MGLSYEWDKQDDKILIWHFGGDWQWGEFDRQLPEVRKLVRSRSPQHIDMIIDFRGTNEIPSGTISHVVAAMRDIPPNFGLAVIIGTGSIFNMLIEILFKTYARARQHAAVAHDDAEAYQFIQKAREKRGDL